MARGGAFAAALHSGLDHARAHHIGSRTGLAPDVLGPRIQLRSWLTRDAPGLDPVSIGIGGGCGGKTGAAVQITEIARHHVVQGRMVPLQPQEIVAAL